MTRETRYTDLVALRAGVRGYLAWCRRRGIDPSGTAWIERVSRDLKEQGFAVRGTLAIEPVEETTPPLPAARSVPDAEHAGQKWLRLPAPWPPDADDAEQAPQSTPQPAKSLRDKHDRPIGSRTRQ